MKNVNAMHKRERCHAQGDNAELCPPPRVESSKAGEICVRASER